MVAENICKLNIAYKFIPRGKSYVSTENKNEVVLDVGGLNENLVFDHHFPGGSTDCAAKLVFKQYKERLRNLKDRLDSLKDNKVPNVTIVIHKEPDFDCLCAAWLVAYYLKFDPFEEFPKGFEWVVNYAALVDSGKLRITNEFFLVPATVIYAFYETVKKETKLTTDDARYRWILDRAFKLMDWCANNLAHLSIEDSDEEIVRLMCEEREFASECEVLRFDVPKYAVEIVDPNVCMKIDQFSVFNKYTNSVAAVPALIYYEPSKSALVKYWARADGYILTLIPQACDAVWSNVEWKPVGFSEKPNRVIISVPPETPYTLQPLAKELERAECELERKLLGDNNAELKRTRTVVRNGYEEENWVINNDPWYDGSSHGYTIVDSPSSASLLTTKRMIEIAMNHTKKDVTQAKINIILPIKVDLNKDGKKYLHENKNKEKRIEIFTGESTANKWKLNKEDPTEDLKDNYLFDSVKNSLDAYDLVDADDVKYIQENVLKLKKKDNYKVHLSDKIEKIRMLLPKCNIKSTSHISFLILSINFGRLMSREISETIDLLNNNHGDISKFLKEEYIKPKYGEIVFKEPVYSVFAEFNGDKMKNLDVGQDVFNACSFLDKTRALTDGRIERTRMEKILHRVNAGIVFGLSRNCFMLASVQGIEKSSFLDEYERKFDEQWLKEWIVILHQHFFMYNVKTQLGSDHVHKGDPLSKLRSELVNFTANFCFAQVTNDPTGADLYDRWKKLLTIDEINKEVSSQVQALNDNVSSSLRDTLTALSLIFFPTSLILSIVSLFGSYIDLPTKILLTVSTIAVNLVIGTGYYLMRRRWLWVGLHQPQKIGDE
jgi:hypothetical protein